MTIGQLDLALLIAAAVLLVAVAAVRLAVRSGLPTLLALPRARAADRRARRRDPVRRRPAHRAARLRRAAAHPRRGWADHPVVGDPGRHRPGRGAGHPRHRRLHPGQRVGRAPPARAGLGQRPAARRDRLLDRRGRRLLGAAPGADATAAGRHARGRVGVQRRARRDRRGRAHRAGRRRDPARPGVPAGARRHSSSRSVPWSGWWSAGSARPGCAGWRCRPPACIRSRCSRWSWWRTRPRPWCTPRASWPPTSPRWCWATRGCRTARPSAASPKGWAGWRRSACSSCSVCSPTRPGCPGRCRRAIALGLVLLLVARPLSVLAGVTWFRVRLPEQVLLSWAGLRGAVPIVLATVPMAAGVPGARQTVRPGLRPRRRLHAGAGPDPAPGGPSAAAGHGPDLASTSTSSPPRWGRSAPTCCRSTSARRRGCTGWRCSSCACPEGANVTLVVRDGEVVRAVTGDHDPARRRSHRGGRRRPSGRGPRPGCARSAAAASSPAGMRPADPGGRGSDRPNRRPVTGDGSGVSGGRMPVLPGHAGARVRVQAYSWHSRRSSAKDSGEDR